jgi:hypothetical protein
VSVGGGQPVPGGSAGECVTGAFEVVEAPGPGGV